MSTHMPSVHARLLGGDLSRLPPAVAALHARNGALVWRGRVDVERGDGILGRIIGAILSLPPAGPDQEIEFRRTPHDDAEIWERIVSGRTFASRLAARDGLLVERLGPALFWFRLIADAGRLHWRYEGARVFGLPLPSALAPRILAVESEGGGRYAFTVSVELPIIGLVVAYRGWLAPAN